MTGKLAGKVALVAGATRGAGRAIALALGEAGATVYCTGRSTRAEVARRSPRPDAPFVLAHRPESIEETAEGVTARGGSGVAARVDHTVPAQVEALAERIRAEQGRLDVLINDVWGGDELAQWATPFWELDLHQALTLLQRAVHSHLITSRWCVPLMIGQPGGLVIEVTDGDGLFYRGMLVYDLVKISVIRLAFAMAEELRPHGVAALALTPGFLRSEAMLEAHGVTEANWRDAGAQDPHFLASESPAYVGRAVVALATDPQVLAKSGGVYSTWGLQPEYGFTDADGSRPDWGAHAAGRDFHRDQMASQARFLAAFGARTDAP
jgi:NAD(P)-dependent dehydrogenase (short-subunit alcohol dehydrogenase family)